MALLPFLAGVLFTAAALILLLPWLRTIPRLNVLPALPWQAGAAALVTLTMMVLLHGRREQADPAAGAGIATPAAPAAQSAAVNVRADTWSDIANSLGAAPISGAGGSARKGAEPMAAAVASLQQRLSKGGGSADDWELLARSYEFLGRPAQAATARAHQLPALAPDDDRMAAGQHPTLAASSAAAVSGVVSLSAALKARAPAGATLFIVAKAVDSPGPPVAVYRTTVSSWPVPFNLTDAQSMLPGRSLSTVGRVSVEARISQSGQPLPAPGDLQGSSEVVDQADRQRLRIVIDKEVR